VKKQEPKDFNYQEALKYLAQGKLVGRADWKTEWLELDLLSCEVVHYDDGVRTAWTPTPEDQASKWELRS
jgi:hypothetical protein